MQAVSAQGSRHCVLMRRLNSSCSHSMAFVTGMIPVVSSLSGWGGRSPDVWCEHPGRGAPGARGGGQADLYDEPRARVSSWPPLRLARLRCERGSVGVV